MNKITSINGIPCNLVKAEIAEDMLSALRKAQMWMACEDDYGMNSHDRDVYNEAMDAINNAINKATQT